MDTGGIPAMAVHWVRPIAQGVPLSQASWLALPQGAHSWGIEVVGSGVKVGLQVLPGGHTGSPLPPQMNSQRIMSVLSL
jgi:hypothetical protein